VAASTARADETQARHALIADLCTKISDLEKRVDTLSLEHQEAEDRRRADEERQAKLDAEPLSSPPGTGREGQQTNDDDYYQPGGEMHTLPPKTEEEPAPAPSLPAPPVSGDQLSGAQEKFILPEPEGEPPGSGVVSQPTAVSLW
jgi:hypothetical protein